MSDFKTEGFKEWWDEAKLKYDGDSSLCALRAWQHQQAHIEKLEADAKRYQHMRSNAAFQDRNGPGLYWYLPRWDRELPWAERLDKAIDDAINEIEKNANNRKEDRARLDPDS